MRWSSSGNAPVRLPSRPAVTDLTQLVRILTSPAPRLEPDECARQLASYPPAAVAETLVRQKVVRLGLERLAHAGVASEPLVRTHPKTQRRLAHVSSVSDSLRAATELLRSAPTTGSIKLIKGMSARGWYDRPDLRELNDVDLLVATCDDAFRLTSYLLGAGYEYAPTELPWIKRAIDGPLYGQINLRSRTRDLPTMDIHFGGYSVRHCALLADAATGRSGVELCGRTDNLPFLLANAGGDYLVTAKDLNDVVLCIRDRTVDWDIVIERIRGVELDGFFGWMLRRIRAICRFDAEDDRLLSQLVQACGREPVVPKDGGRPWRRWLGTTVHAYRHGRRTGWSRAARTATSAARYYRASLRLALTERPGGDLPPLNPWTCVRLVPVEAAVRLLGTGRVAAPRETLVARWSQRSLAGGEGALEILETPVGDLVASMDTVFVPTVYYRLSRGLVQGLAQ